MSVSGDLAIVTVVLLLLILLSKPICHLHFSILSVVITWMVKHGCDSEIWKVSSIGQICANGLAVGTLAFKI